MRLVAWGLWLASVHLAQAAGSGRHGHRNLRKRQGTGEAEGFEGLRLSYITETTTQMMTETTTVMQTIQNEATGAAETATVTVTEVVTQACAEVPPPITVTETITEAVPQLVTVVDVSPVTIVENIPITVVDVVTQPVPQEPVTVTVAGAAPPPVTLIETVEVPAVASDVAEVQQPEAPLPEGPGVTTIPIAESALPTTTFGQDPLADPQLIESTTLDAGAPVDTSEASSAADPVPSAPAQEPSAAPNEPAPTEETSAAPAPAPTEETSAASNEPVQTADTSAASSAPAQTEETSDASKASVQTEDTSAASSTVPAAESSQTLQSSGDASATQTEEETATTSDAAVQTEETSTSSSTVRTMDSNLTLQPSAADPSAQPTDLANSLDLGGLGPDATADVESAVLAGPDPTGGPDAEAPSSLARIPINISSLTLSSVLNLGNLAGEPAVLKARATGTP
ncbi:hypothetical protein ACJZ2D_012272 [Fusarium nematophilum]